MKTGIGAVIACCLLTFAAGCGSSGSTGNSSSSTTATTGAGTTTAAKTAGAATGTKTSSAAAGGIKGDTTPKFASPSSSAPVQSGVVQIAYRNIAIDPDTVRVKVGSTIKWTNYDSAQANVTSVGGPQRIASKNFGEGSSFEVKVEKPGVIHYECTLYPTTMNGTIEVVS
ncbi:MAG TPA: plastocyanin/azurin family copper-binding protein [Solirubrobacteraceae bacterium]